jgi:hypothetical protein
VNAFQGSSSISSDVEVDLSSITVNRLYNGTTSTASAAYYDVTATSGEGQVKKFPLQITIYGIGTEAQGKTACQADALIFTIPVYAEGTPTNQDNSDDVVMNITFVASGSQTGAAGSNRESSYIWIRYANSNNPTWAETSDNPAGMDYMGISQTTTDVEPTDPSLYSWSLIKGQDGTNGDDAYTFVVKSSAGDVFRNNSGSTTITLYIYKSDMQHLTAAEYQTEVGGTLKWFKDDVPASGNTGQVTSSIDADGNSYITVNASSVATIASYFVVLEK